MRHILIISDVHLGNGQGYDIYAGEDALPNFLDKAVHPDTLLLVNGDFADFLMNEDPLVLERDRAIAQAQALVAWPPTAAVLQALGRALARGAQVVIRLGNHDAELGIPTVQAVLRGALGQPEAVARRLAFQLGDKPAIEEIGGARVLITHGEHNDPWNRFDAAPLATVPAQGGSDFVYPPGSRLVKTIMNPLKRKHGLRFVDLLKPDIQGGVLTALAVDPGAVSLVFQGSTLSLMWQLFHERHFGDLSFEADGAEPEAETGLHSALDEAGLTEDERQALRDVLDPSGGLSFGSGDSSALDGARFKLARRGLAGIARLQKRLTGDDGTVYFDTVPLPAEWEEAHRLADKFKVDAVLLGHSHAARFGVDKGRVYVNSGTWITQLSLPAPDAPAAAWAAYLHQLCDNPGLDPAKGATGIAATRFNAAAVEVNGAGKAVVQLLEIDAQGRSRVTAQHTLG